jgi:hypothetical protein
MRSALDNTADIEERDPPGETTSASAKILSEFYETINPHL